MAKAGQNQERIGVLLFNLGGPETLDDVKPFLFNLFSDPDIIRLPWRALQKPLAWIISTSRYKKSRGYYEQIGGGSPLRKITDEQARALEGALARRGIEAKAYVGMRYWKPFTEEAIAADSRRPDNAPRSPAALPAVLHLDHGLKPQPDESHIRRERRQRRRASRVIESWQDDPQYINALARMVREELARFPDQTPSGTHIVFSAHSVPVSYIKEGDPYLDQTRQTVEMVMKQIGKDRPHSLSFQSKVGPVKWLRPSTDETIRRLACGRRLSSLARPRELRLRAHRDSLRARHTLPPRRRRGRAPSLQARPRAQLPARFYRRARKPCRKRTSVRR